MAKTSTQRMREYRERIREKKKELNITKKTAKSAAERARDYRARKRAKGESLCLNLDSSCCEELSISLDPSSWFTHEQIDQNHNLNLKSCVSSNMDCHELSTSNMEENIEDMCDFKTFEVVQLKPETEGDEVQPLIGEVPPDIEGVIKQELSEESNENILVKQECPDSEYPEEMKDCVVKQEPGIETGMNADDNSSIWIKQEAPDIDQFISENSEYLDSSIGIKQEFVGENTFVSKMENSNASDDEDDDVSFVCEIPAEKVTNFLHKCSKCRFVTCEISALNEHMNTSHTKLKCTWCDFSTFQTAQLKAHVQRVHVQNTYKTINGSVEVSETIQKTPPKLKLQIIDIRKPDPSNVGKLYECSYCEFVGKGASHLNKHTLVHRNVKNYTGQNFTQHSCPYCQFVTEHKKEYLAHRTNCLRYKCSETYCRYMTSIREDLWDHIVKEHRNENNFMEKYKMFKPKFKCSQKLCKFITNNSKDYVHHMEVHAKNDNIETNRKYSREYKCSEDVCGYTTNIREDLWDHIILYHRKEKNTVKKLTPKYKCTEKFCRFNTIFKEDLLRHIDVHRGRKECGYTTRLRQDMWGNIIKKHEKTTEIIQVKCHWCSFSSNQTAKLKEHVQKVHVRSTYKSASVQK